MKPAFAISKSAFKDAAPGACGKYAETVGNKLDAEINPFGMLPAYGVASCSVLPKKKFGGGNL